MTKTKQALVQFSAKTIDEAPEYYSYAFPVQKIKEYLKTKTGHDFQLYVDSDTSNEIWEVLEEDLELHPESVTELASVFDCLEMGIISSNHTDKEMELILKPSLYNHLYYYEKHNLALVRMPAFQKNELTQYDYILASSEESLSSFLDYVLKRKRDYIKDYVTIFIDTEDGVENHKEKITTLVKRDEVFLEDKLKNQIYRSIDEFFTNGGEFFIRIKFHINVESYCMESLETVKQRLSNRLQRVLKLPLPIGKLLSIRPVIRFKKYFLPLQK